MLFRSDLIGCVHCMEQGGCAQLHGQPAWPHAPPVISCGAMQPIFALQLRHAVETHYSQITMPC
jgi:hypothetical protein